MILKSIGLFFITAFAELLGSYLMYLWLRQGRPVWYAIPAVCSLFIQAFRSQVPPKKWG